MEHFFVKQSLIQGDYKLSDIRVNGQLGHGNNNVYSVTIHNIQYALKQIQISTDYQYQNFLQQISTLKQLSLTNSDLIKYQGYFLTNYNKTQHFISSSNTNKFAYIVMQYAEMNLNQLISKKKSEHTLLSFPEIQRIMDILIRGFTDLQSDNVAHCDIKPENILVSKYSEQSKFDVKICDVGSCKIVDSESLQDLTIYGTLPFLAPELIKLQSKKIISSNPFRTDVFSFGLVILYAITGKKFSSKQRKQIPSQTYQEIILEWIKQAEELSNSEPHIIQILKRALQFNQFKRLIFIELKILFDSYKRKKRIQIETKTKKLLAEETQKQNQFQGNKTKYQMTIGGKTTRTNTKLGFNSKNKLSTKFSSTALNKTKSKILSPLLKYNRMKTTLSSDFSLDKSKVDIGPIIYINKVNKDTIPYDQIAQEDLIFVLFSPDVKFKAANIVSIMPLCSLSVIYSLAETVGNSLYIQYEGVQAVSVDEDAPLLDYKNVHINLDNSCLSGGYNNLLRSLCPIFLTNLSLRVSNSQIKISEIYQQLQRLKNRDIKSFQFVYDNALLSSQDHNAIIQKISKISTLKQLKISMNSNFINYNQEQMRWLLPSQLQTLYLSYENNFLGSIIHNLVFSLKNQNKLRELYMNFRNNNLKDTEMKMLLNVFTKGNQIIQKLIMNLSMNPINNPKYVFDDFIDEALSNNFNMLKSLELRINQCQISEKSFFSFFQGIVQIFMAPSSKLRILKIAYDRKITQKIFTEMINEVIKQCEYLKAYIIPYNTEFYMIYIEKKKIFSKNMIRIHNKQKITSKKQKIQKTEEKKNNVCARAYTKQSNYDKYVCLTCIGMRQLSKNQYFCKTCIQSCDHKGHHIVRTYQKKQCSCAYNQDCLNMSSKIQGQICADKIGIRYKKVYHCRKCIITSCQICIKNCQENHQQWVDCLNSGYYKCQTVIN